MDIKFLWDGWKSGKNVFLQKVPKNKTFFLSAYKSTHPFLNGENQRTLMDSPVLPEN
jgi:hypothetical protein